MNTVENDDIQIIRKDVLTIQDAVLSIIARLDALSPQDNAGKSPVASVLSAEDAEQQKKIIESGDGYAAYAFALSVTGADMAALQQVVVDRGNGWDAYRFAKDIQGADIAALQEVLLKRGDGFDVYHFAKDIPDADLPSLHKRLVELHSTGSDTNTANDTDNKRYLDTFNSDQDIQAKLKTQLEAAGLSEGNTQGKKHRPS